MDADSQPDVDDEDAAGQLRADLLREAAQAARHARAWHQAQTERLKVYATLLRVTLPRIGASARLDAGQNLEIDPDVVTARDLAIEMVFADIRRIAGGVSPRVENQPQRHRDTEKNN